MSLRLHSCGACCLVSCLGVLPLSLLSFSLGCLQTRDSTYFLKMDAPGAPTDDLGNSELEGPFAQLVGQLAEEPVRDALCAWAVASSAPEPSCEGAFQRCQVSLGALSLVGGRLSTSLAGLDQPVNLEPLLGCPASLDDLDACGADLLAWMADRQVGSSVCEPLLAPEELGLRDFLALGDCVMLARKCQNWTDGVDPGGQ